MRYVVLLCFLVAFRVNLNAQVTGQNALGFPSTDNVFSGKTGIGGTGANVDVDTYTGTALANVDLCNLTAMDLSIPIGLNYTGGHGIKLQDYATCVGLGWQLNAGGSISRVVRGFPDEQTNGYLGGGWGNTIAGWTGWGQNFVQGNLSTAQFTALTTDLSSNGEPTADGEPDLFTVQTPFFSFQFVLDGNGNAQIDNNNGYLINFDRTNQIFTVKDDQGNQYFFASSKQSFYGDLESTVSTLYNVLYTYVSTWYLDKIVTFNSKETITLNYISGNNGAYYYDTTYHYQFYELTRGGTPQLTNNNQMSIVQVPLYVSSIVSTQGEVDFSYVWDRQDDHNAARLSTIALKAFNPVTQSNSTTLRTYTFNTSYFGSPSTDPNVLRMRLDNITVTDNTSSNGPLTLETFGYNQSNVMPARNSNCFDWLGYCSVASTSQFYTDPAQFLNNVSQVRSPTNMAMTDVLQSITDLYGGSWSITYQLNDFGTSLNKVGGLRVYLLSRTDPVANQTLTRTYTYTDVNGYSTGTLYNINYNILVQDFAGTLIYFSECPYSTADLNGNFVGYSSVTVAEPNGGTTVYGFSNFTSDPDVFTSQMAGSSGAYQFTSSASMAYRRGLLKTESVYKAGSTTPLYTITNNYTAQTTAVHAAKAYRPMNVGAVLGGNGASDMGWGVYYTNQENYRLTSTVRTDYDPVQTTNSVTRTTSYSYVAPNWRMVHSTSTTDSKGSTSTYTKTYYHPDDGASIPMVTNPSPELTTLTTMVNANAINVLVHETDALNSAIHHSHNVYGSYSTGLATNVYLSQSNAYVGPISSPTLVRQKTYTFDPKTSQLIDLAAPGDKSVAMLYGYNNSFPVAKVVNASASASFTSQQSTTTQNIMSVPGSISFTTAYAGNIVLRLMPGSSQTGVNFNLVGPVGGNENAVLCAGSNCGAYTTTYTQQNAPAGNYTLSITGNSPGSSVSCTYPIVFSTYSNSAEFFYEGFEQSNWGSSGTAHSGHGFDPNNYTVSWSPPDSRAYTIQWWNLLNGVWTFNQQPYSSGVVLTGPVDDVRVFPSDALMTTTTYNPLLGKTSETDPAGHTQTYEYDGLGRLVRVRDENGNIIQQYQYGYQTALHQ
jgi:YD repeat-containing protein